MTDRVYIQPLSFVASAQAADGDALRLAGGLLYAREFAITVTRNGAVAQRNLATASTILRAFEKLPASLAEEAERQWSNLQLAHPPLHCGERIIRLDQPQIMGILNVTPDSFSDGGQFMDDPQVARDHAAAMVEAGAALIDIGGESTRPKADPVWEGDEIARVVPAVKASVAMGAAVSVDTRKPAVMQAALTAGAHVVNDVSALRYDPRAIDLVAQASCPVILMHSPGPGDGTGGDLHSDANYGNVLFDVFDWLREARDRAVAGGVARELIVLDPGIGFGKSMAENLALMQGLALFHALGQPVILGASRKRMIGAMSNEAPAHRRLGGSLALALAGMAAGVQILRVHDVFETVQARNVWRGQRDAALMDFSGLA